MVGIDTTRSFQPVNIAILTVSDSRTMETDKSVLLEASPRGGPLGGGAPDRS